MRRYNTLLKGIAIAVMALTSMISFDAQSQYNRPQTPVPPYPYDTLEYVVNNTKANVQLSGTLTMPDNPKAVIVMATGSGSQNRDEEMFGHRPFKVIADYLSRNGYAVLRTDDRGIGQSTGDATLATTDDFA
ncbi:MAG: alpha/beta hydrolase, partial [Muribaculaceae bacterium]|nr:alpha/beta hydrolase [Muribaculaceae bacterium]